MKNEKTSTTSETSPQTDLLAADDQSALRQLDVPRPARDRATRTLKLTVANVGFLLDRLGEDCAPLQFIRELTQNSLEAGARHLQWDQDLGYKLPNGTTVPKLSLSDDGKGMSGPEMVTFINQLASSGKLLGHEANFGVGAKIAAATRNHAGLVYLSWQNGQGAMVHLWRDPKTKEYGLKQLERPDGTMDVWAPIDAAELKPDIIKEHGTKVILLGNNPLATTMEAPPEAASPSTWIARYLNSRYYRLPPNTKLMARQGWNSAEPTTNLLRHVTGQEPYLRKHANTSGSLTLGEGTAPATAHWWILKDSPALGQNSGIIESSGHLAALHRDELYELTSGRQALAKLQQFGILFGARQVVIYIEPTAGPDITSNTARTDLRYKHEPLPWGAWASEFRDRMPEALASFMEEIASKGEGKDHGASIRERLKPLMALFDVRRFRPIKGGELRIAEPEATMGGERPPAEASDELSVPSVPGDQEGEAVDTDGGPVGGVYSAAVKNEGRRGERAEEDPFPVVQWISIAESTREEGDLEDRAARYLDDQNTILVNADFRAFTEMEALWVGLYESEKGKTPGLKQIVRDLVHQWYEQSLIETIIGLQGLRGSREWTLPELQQAWSETSLTAVVMQRYHPHNAVKRDLAIRISSLKPAKAAKAG